MKLIRIKELLKADVLCLEECLDNEIKIACGSDLMSDVLAFIKPNALLLTGLTNSQVVRTAEMAEVSAICFVRGKTPDTNTIELAKERKIPLLTTKYSMYECCGRMYQNGLPACGIPK